MQIERVKLEPKLYIVATPIGNLKDVTLRALEVLSSADIIACEDTRVTKKLLDSYGISTKMTVYNDHSDKAGRDRITQMIASGKSVALVSDAGTPLISDPGYKLVLDCINKNLKVTTCPGASSVISAIALSGLPSDSFYFGGFLPQNKGQKENVFKSVKQIRNTLIYMDRGSRLLSTLEAIQNVFGNIRVAVVREITKLYEESIIKDVSELISVVSEKELKGEMLVLIDNASSESRELSTEEIDSILKELLSNNTVKSASEIAFLEYGINKKLAYKRLLELKEA